ncbi:MAG: MCE family protein, partial [Candidatus Omnitrophica bacterium]|nr:MCE family protein [Candidatus Omnitrophota bacterium]
VFLMFLIVFSISDMYVLKKGYNLFSVFDMVNGITANAPVRLAGVHVGDIKKAEIYFDETLGKPRVKLDIRINGDVKISSDAVARINTLGLLGEQYLEITPGKSKQFLEYGDKLLSKNPINVGSEMEKMKELMQSTSQLIQHIERGEGTLGKLLTDDTLYNDLTVIFGRLKRGEGTLGKLLVEEEVYDDMEEFTEDIKKHPWKLLHKSSSNEK